MRTPAVLAVAALAALAFGSVPSIGASTWGVEVSNYAFSPPVLKIAAGDTVVWTNVAPIEHEVECHLKLAEGVEPPTCLEDFEADLEPGQSFGYTFNTPGVYLINCNLGGLHHTMKQLIVVGVA